MLKVTSRIIEAFLNGKTICDGNSATDNYTMRLHGNLIAEIRADGTLAITNAGWFSRTTKERLNGIPGVSIYQKKGDWYLNGRKWDGGWITIGKVDRKGN
jgi:hypothetical protein